jgi:hypothetical protein
MAVIPFSLVIVAGGLPNLVILELGLIQSQMAQKPVLRAEVYARGLYPSKNLRGAAGFCLGTTIKYLRRTARERPWQNDQATATHYERRRGQRTTRQQPWHHDQVPATHYERRRGHRPWYHDQEPSTHNEPRRGQRPGPIPGIIDVPIHHKRPAYTFLVRASVANKHYSTAEIRDLGAQCVCVCGARACSLCS